MRMKPSLEPVVWTPPPRAQQKGRPATLPAMRCLPLPARGEDVAIDRAGRLFAGLEDGRVVCLESESSAPRTVVNTGGRPIGLEVAPDGSLVVCDALRGLLRVDPAAGAIEVLLDAVAHDLRFCNNAALARDGSIYFSDSSRRFGLAHWRADIVEHSGTGRLFKLAPDGTLELLLEGLQFANGVALAADESFVAVAETGAYRVTRYWLEGGRRGWTDLLIDDLPGFPDNLSSNERGEIWIALASPRNPVLDFLHRSRPVLRSMIWALPERLQPSPARQVHAMAVNGAGEIVHDLYGSAPWFHLVTGMREHDGQLYLASLDEPALAVLTLPR